MSQSPIHKRTGHREERQRQAYLIIAEDARAGSAARHSSSRALQAHLDILSYTQATDDLRELFTVQEGLSRAEHASLLNQRSQFARDDFERGANIAGSVLSIPKDADGRPRDAEKVTIGSQAHAIDFVREITRDESAALEKGTRLYELACKACGQLMDSDGRLAIFKTIYDQIRKDEQGNYRSREEKAMALDTVLEETARWAEALPEPMPETTPWEVHARMLELARSPQVIERILESDRTETGLRLIATEPPAHSFVRPWESPLERDELQRAYLEELSASSARVRAEEELSYEGIHEGFLNATFEYDGATHDESEVYAEMYEAAIAVDADLWQPEQDHQVAETRGGGGFSLDATYDRINLDDLVPALPDGLVTGGELTGAGRQLFQGKLAQVDRALGSGASRKEILDALYKEHAEAERAERAEKIASLFARAGAGGRDTREATREEHLLALTTLRVLVGGEYLRETRGYSREAIQWAKQFDAQNQSRYHTLFDGAGEQRPGARVSLKRGEREKLRELDRAILDSRDAARQAAGHEKAPSRTVVDRLNQLEETGGRVAAMIDRLNPTMEERLVALNVVGSRAERAQLMAEMKLEEYEKLLALESALASQTKEAQRTGEEVPERLTRDRRQRVTEGIERARHQLSVAAGMRVESPQEARERLGPHLRGLGALTNVVERNAGRLGGSFGEHISEEKTPVFVSLAANPRQRLPVGNIHEHEALEKAAGELRVNLTVWPGLFHAEGIGARPSEERAQEALFISNYIDYRLKDHETRMRNERPLYREYSERLDGARTPEELRAAAREIRKDNYARDQQFKAHLLDPKNTSAPEERALPLHEMRELFLSAPPEHYTAEMREIKFAMSIMGRDKTERTAALHRGTLKPSRELTLLLKELDTRQSERSLNHYYRSLRQPMDRPSALDLRSLHEGLQQYERDYLNDKISERYDATGGKVPQTHTEERADATRRAGAPQRAGKASEHTSSAAYRAYSGAAWWTEAQLLSVEETRLEQGIADSPTRRSVIRELPDSALKAAVHVLENFSPRAQQDVIDHLKTSERGEDHVVAEVITVLGDAREVARGLYTREISIRVPEDSRLSDESWERLMDLVQKGQEEGRENKQRVSDARRAEIRREAQTSAWKELEPRAIGETDQILDAPAELIYQTLDLREALARAESLQDRARTAHYAAEEHVTRCVEKAARALSDGRAERAFGEVYREEVLRIGQEAIDRGDQRREEAAVQVFRGETPTETRDLRHSIMDEARRLADAAANEARNAPTTKGERETLRALVEAALDPAQEKAQAQLISEHQEQFALIKETLTRDDGTRYGALKQFAASARDEYSRVFPELDQKQATLELTRAAAAHGQQPTERELTGTSARSPSMILYQQEAAARERELLTLELEEAIRRGEIPARDPEGEQVRLTGRDLLPEAIQQDARAVARADTWLQLVPAEIRSEGAGARIDQEVFIAALELGETVEQAQALERELEEARQELKTFIRLEVAEAEKTFREDRAREAYQSEYVRSVSEAGQRALDDGQEERAQVARELLVELERDGSQAWAHDPSNSQDGYKSEIATAARASAERARDEAREKPLYNSLEEQLAITETVLSGLDEQKSEQLQALGERAAESLSRFEQSFIEIDERRDALEAAREESFARTRIEAMRELSEPLAERVGAYVQTTAREEGVISLRDPVRAEHHIAMLSDEIMRCAEEHGVSLEKLSFDEEHVNSVARHFFSSLSESLGRAEERAFSQNAALENSRDGSMAISEGLLIEQTARATHAHAASHATHVHTASAALESHDHASTHTNLEPVEHASTAAHSSHDRSAARENAEGFRGDDFGKVRERVDPRLEHTHEVGVMMH